MTQLINMAALSQLYGNMTLCRRYGTDDPDTARRRLAEDVAELREFGGHAWSEIARILEIDEATSCEVYENTDLTEPGDEHLGRPGVA